MQTDPVWNDHVWKAHFFLTSQVVVLGRSDWTSQNIAIVLKLGVVSQKMYNIFNVVL